MDFFNDVLNTFLVLGMFQLHCCLRRVRKLSDLIKNTLNCGPKMNEGLTGLEQHEGGLWMTSFSFLGELTQVDF